jgi:hypothetical protein
MGFGAGSDQLDMIIAGTSTNYREETTIVEGNYQDAIDLARGEFSRNPNLVYLAVQFTGAAQGANGVGGVVIFYDVQGDDNPDFAVTLLGTTLADLANDGSFIV